MSADIPKSIEVNQKYLDSLQERINEAFRKDTSHTELLSQ